MSTETPTTQGDEAVETAAATEDAQVAKPKRSILDRLLDLKFATLFLGLVLSQVFIIPLAVPGLLLDNQPLFKGTHIFQNIAGIIAGILIAVWYGHHFKRMFDGTTSWSSEGLKLALPTLSFAVVTIAEAIVNKTAPNPLPVALIGALAPGVTEEVIFRSLPISNWMRIDGRQPAIIACTLATALVFGIIHGANALAGAPLYATLFQVFYAACLGVAFAAVFLRTGSIWPSVIMHTLIDFAAMCFMDSSKNGLITEELTIGPAFYITIVLSLAIAAYGFYLLRPEKRPEIVALWDKKWSRSA